MPVCEVCSREFEGRADARYCEPACRQKAYRAKALPPASDLPETGELEPQEYGELVRRQAIAQAAGFPPVILPDGLPRLIRRAYICRRCQPVPTRTFLERHAKAPGICAQHGPMEWQRNAPYMGQPTPVHPD